MEYKSNITFAIRSIELYEKNPLKESYGFTAICGVLLNVLSAIRPDQKPLLNNDNLCVSDFPHLSDIKEINNYIRLLVNGLKHKDNSNFKEFIEPENREIRHLNIKSNSYTEEDFKLIYKALKNGIIEKYSEDLPEECSRITFM